ncbi:MAG: hypothetical protein AAFO91_04175 [Bacteroidota bacterium]
MTRNINELFQNIYDNGKLLTHQETDPKIRLTQTWSSTFVKSKGLLVKGEQNNPKSSERNAMIVVFHPKTGQVKGGLGVVFVSKPKGRGLTSNSTYVYSVSHYEFKKQIYLLTTGSAGNLDVFRLADFGDSGFASRILDCGFCVSLLFVCLSLIGRASQNRQAPGIRRKGCFDADSRRFRICLQVSWLLQIFQSVLLPTYNF